MVENYQLIRLRNGAWTLRLGKEGEVMHPGEGPAAEAKALYVEQLNLRERFNEWAPFVIWDVGLGAGANAAAAFDAAGKAGKVKVHLVSFDITLAPFQCALMNLDSLLYLRAYERPAHALLAHSVVDFHAGSAPIRWELRSGNFPKLLSELKGALPKPHAIFFDPFSPSTNPGMWTLEVFRDLFTHCDPREPCALATYSRSTRVRTGLLLAGFFVGRGRPSGRKEETTVAANMQRLLAEPLDKAWLERVHRSRSAEPIRNGDYSERAISEKTLERLKAHPQFQ